MKRLACLLFFAAVSVVAHAGGKHGHEHGHEADSRIGAPGEAEDVTRTVEVLLHDNYYEPESITVGANETIRFVIKNAGVLVHEFNIGTAEMHAAHKDEMMMMMRHGVLFPDRIDREKMEAGGEDGHSMKHDDPNSVLLEPGEEGEIVWAFVKAVELEFACNVPGHYESGMTGEFFWK